MIRLGVNIDHIATVRNARGEVYPDPCHAAVMAQLGGADNITFHLREDRRHIRDRDVFALKETVSIPLNFEMAATPEMVGIAAKVKPHAITLVPERRAELTTEGGLDVVGQKKNLSEIIKNLADTGAVISLFIESDPQVVVAAKEVGAHAVEFHTGKFCKEFDSVSFTKDKHTLLADLKKASQKAKELDLQVHLGHGLNYGNANWMQLIAEAEEANIGHAIVARALFVGLTQAVREMKELLNNPALAPRPK